MSYVLYAVEVDETSGCDLVHERGAASPLVWDTRDEAEQFVREVIMERKALGGMRVIELTMTARFPEPYFCNACTEKAWREGKRDGEELVWGSFAEHARHNA
jgi:hypothetical protein